MGRDNVHLLGILHQRSTITFPDRVGRHPKRVLHLLAGIQANVAMVAVLVKVEHDGRFGFHEIIKAKGWILVHHLHGLDPPDLVRGDELCHRMLKGFQEGLLGQVDIVLGWYPGGTVAIPRLGWDRPRPRHAHGKPGELPTTTVLLPQSSSGKGIEQSKGIGIVGRTPPAFHAHAKDRGGFRRSDKVRRYRHAAAAAGGGSHGTISVRLVSGGGGGTPRGIGRHVGSIRDQGAVAIPF